MASPPDQDELSPPTGLRIGRWVALATLLVLAIGFAILWATRERIADDFIADQLADYGIEATYRIERIGGRRQVLRDVVVGDTDRPDLTVERAEIVLRYRFGYPRIAQVVAAGPLEVLVYPNGGLLQLFAEVPAVEPVIRAAVEHRLAAR